MRLTVRQAAKIIVLAHRTRFPGAGKEMKDTHTYAREIPLPDDPEITASLWELLHEQQPLTWVIRLVPISEGSVHCPYATFPAKQE